jgi:hypothetical protein
MATNGKLQSRITVPTGGWDLAITEVPTNSATITVPAGTYYHSSADSEAEGLLDTIQTLIEAAVTATDLDGTYTVSLSDAESGTGKVTIAATGITSFSIAWTDSELQDLLGFTSTPSGALTYTGESQTQALWIGSYPWQKLNGGIRGGWVSDQQNKNNSAGYVYSVMGQKYRQTRIAWPMEPQSKTWAENETTVNASFEQFYLDAILGEAAWGTSTGPIRFHPSASVDDNYATYSVLGMESWEPVEVVQHWAGGQWRIDLPRLIEVPGSALSEAGAEPEVYTIATLTPAQVATILGKAAPTLMYRFDEASGATELVSGTDNWSDINTPDKQVASAVLGTDTTEPTYNSADACAAADSTVGQSGTSTLTGILIYETTNAPGLNLLLCQKRYGSAPNEGWEVYTNSSGHLIFALDNGGTTQQQTIASDHGTASAEVVLWTNSQTDDVAGIWSRLDSSVSTALTGDFTGSGRMGIGGGAGIGSIGRSASGARHALLLFWIGSDGDGFDDSDRVALAQALELE